MVMSSTFQESGSVEANAPVLRADKRKQKSPCDMFSIERPSIRYFRRGDVIASAGTLLDSFVKVQHGIVTGSTTLADGREFIIEIIPQRECFGELQVLRRKRLTLEYRAASECELHFYDGRNLRERHASDPELRERLLTKALARVSDLELRMIENAASSLQARLAIMLLRLADSYGRDTPAGKEVMISQHDLAATLPASREKVNQCLRRLRQNKVIDQAPSRGRICILDPEALQTYAEQGSF
ncbi:Crp/Fnr family transcriptional regulator [Rhizobium halophytocola]|uniref:CRP-like cAMP-binding protein n=1 Tax=Rhizobium halophytocola TaxID=735519 RepID=A0ABS4E5G8_9HYPH|nr:Crp/Fnr family transcriptional regulator [Rhizobium halophytocola]MBP1853194.1 CRP-like cAMP-binding protein [Rhizobium halophytocola]